MQTPIKTLFMRGGTSRGPFFNEADLPADLPTRDRVLLARYPDAAAHSVERMAALALVDEVSTAAAQRITDLRQQRKALDQEMEFYGNNPAKALYGFDPTAYLGVYMPDTFWLANEAADGGVHPQHTEDAP